MRVKNSLKSDRGNKMKNTEKNEKNEKKTISLWARVLAGGLALLMIAAVFFAVMPYFMS